jgi:NADPH:quinone reductase-like Zn-dependent oxidoreductase
MAGRVRSVGTAVREFLPGDPVFGVGRGSFAQFAVAKAAHLAAMPANLSFAEAAAVPVSGTTALLAVREHGKVNAGQHVLVVGASGGVGSYAVQIAKARGAQVTGVCGPTKLEAVRSIGADHVIDYTRQDLTDLGERFDVVIDIGGRRTVRQLRKLLTDRGTLVVVGGEGGGRGLGGRQRLLWVNAWSPFVKQQLKAFIAETSKEDLVELRELIELECLRPVTDRAFDLVDAPAAITYVAEGRATGKVVITT